MYSPFLWRIAKGQSWLIKGWSLWSRTSSINMLAKHEAHWAYPTEAVHVCLNGHNSIQHTTQGRVARCRWWRIHISCRVYICLSKRVTRRRRPRSITYRRLYSRELAFNWDALCLRKVAPIGAMICTSSNAGKFFNPKSKIILWIKTRKNKPWDLAILLWTSTSE